LPTDRKGRFKKDHRFRLRKVAIWPPASYFGRVNVITIMDSIPSCPFVSFVDKRT
jgi:hypothetical protein